MKAMGTPDAKEPSGIAICDQCRHSTGCTSMPATSTRMPQVVARSEVAGMLLATR